VAERDDIADKLTRLQSTTRDRNSRGANPRNTPVEGDKRNGSGENKYFSYS
jgi:hypothetical protein